MTVPGDGKSLLVASFGDDAVVSLDRAADGTVSDHPGSAGCVTQQAISGCSAGRTLDGPIAVAASPDGRSVYAAVSGKSPAGTATPGGLAIFSRTPAANSTPTCANLGPLATPSETPLQVQLTCSDVEDGVLTFQASDPPHGSLGAVGADGKVTYTPDENYVGPDSFTVKANDGTVDSAAATVNINVTNRAPSCQAIGGVLVGLGAPFQIQLVCTDPESQPLTLSATDPPHGSLGAIGADQKVTYTPDPGYSGDDSFTYKANDGSVDSAAATVSMNVKPTVNLTVVKTGTGSGIVIGYRTGDILNKIINCGNDCEELFEPGSHGFHEFAAADPGSRFTASRTAPLRRAPRLAACCSV